MFGIGKLKEELKYAEWKRESDRISIRSLEHKVADLTNALEWHVGSSLELVLAEEKHIMLTVANSKKKTKRFGETGVQAAEEIYGMVDQSVKQKLDESGEE